MNDTAYGDTEAETAAETTQQKVPQPSKGKDTAFGDTPSAEPAQFDALHDHSKKANADGSDVNLDVILDVGVTLSMEVGRVKIPIRNLLQLSQGSVVELDRLAGEPLDVFVNGTLIAHGEVVMVNEKFGIRLTDVVSPAERIRKLR
ncbi:flagellar motor switch protein FliN [Algiphilus sp.]|uniref:flagellar motor switch protein FliN n=1 Tax=Algiphilus sp. TaxID=1872431 RepID=UPI003B519A0E